MVSHANDVTVFVTRPVSAVALVLAAGLVVWGVVKTVRLRARSIAS